MKMTDLILTILIVIAIAVGIVIGNGKAFDIRTSIYNKADTARLIASLRQFDETLDIVDEGDHIHIEKLNGINSRNISFEMSQSLRNEFEKLFLFKHLAVPTFVG